MKKFNKGDLWLRCYSGDPVNLSVYFEDVFNATQIEREIFKLEQGFDLLSAKPCSINNRPRVCGEAFIQDTDPLYSDYSIHRFIMEVMSEYG